MDVDEVIQDSNFSAMNMESEIMIRKLTLFFVPITFAVILILGLIGNILVIIVVYRNPQMKNTTNLLILNLAVADLLFILVCVPATASDYILMFWPFGLTWCRTVQYIIYVTAYVSIYTLVLMAGDRFLAVVLPVSSLTYRTITNTKLAIVITWVTPMICSMPIWWAHSLMSTDTHSICCFDRQNYSFSAFHVSFFISSFSIPTTIIVIMYIIMLVSLWKSSTFSTSKEGMKAKKRVTALVFTVILVFIVCWSPIQIVLLYKSVTDSDDWDTDYSMIIIQLVPILKSRRTSSILQYEMTSRRKRRNGTVPRLERSRSCNKEDSENMKEHPQVIKDQLTLNTKLSMDLETAIQ